MTGRGRSALAVVAALFAACGPSRPPERPGKVPATAVWAGGPDGGSWIACARDDDGDAYSCTVWSDPAGEVEAKGEYRLHGASAAVSAPLRFTGFDGEVILLADGRLEPVTEK